MRCFNIVGFFCCCIVTVFIVGLFLRFIVKIHSSYVNEEDHVYCCKRFVKSKISSSWSWILASVLICFFGFKKYLCSSSVFVLSLASHRHSQLCYFYFLVTWLIMYPVQSVPVSSPCPVSNASVFGYLQCPQSSVRFVCVLSLQLPGFPVLQSSFSFSLVSAFTLSRYHHSVFYPLPSQSVMSQCLFIAGPQVMFTSLSIGFSVCVCVTFLYFCV